MQYFHVVVFVLLYEMTEMRCQMFCLSSQNPSALPFKLKLLKRSFTHHCIVFIWILPTIDNLVCGLIGSLVLVDVYYRELCLIRKCSEFTMEPQQWTTWNCKPTEHVMKFILLVPGSILSVSHSLELMKDQVWR